MVAPATSWVFWPMFNRQSPIGNRQSFDGLNRRIKKFINTGEDETYDEFRHFFYNNAWQVLETRKTTTVDDQPETLKPEFQYVWSLRYIDSPVLRDKNTDADDLCNDERLYYLNDANMNVTALVQGLLGHEHLGKVVERYMYDPYGKVTALHGDPAADADGGGVTEWNEDTSPDWDNCILYCGYYRDAETGLYHVRNRMYHIYLSWVQRDEDYYDGMSLYEYVQSAPVYLVDWLAASATRPATGPASTQAATRPTRRRSYLKEVSVPTALLGYGEEYNVYFTWRQGIKIRELEQVHTQYGQISVEAYDANWKRIGWAAGEIGDVALTGKIKKDIISTRRFVGRLLEGLYARKKQVCYLEYWSYWRSAFVRFVYTEEAGGPNDLPRKTWSIYRGKPGQIWNRAVFRYVEGDKLLPLYPDRPTHGFAFEPMWQGWPGAQPEIHHETIIHINLLKKTMHGKMRWELPENVIGKGIVMPEFKFGPVSKDLRIHGGKVLP